MNLNRIAKQLLTFAFVLTLIYSCQEDEDYCTQTVKVPRWDPVKKTFVDSFKKVPCSCPCDCKKKEDKSRN